jgi:hypothetical protein
MNLRIEMHPDKSKIFSLYRGADFLGFKIFYHNKRVRKRNVNNFRKKIEKLKRLYLEDKISKDKFISIVEGWFAYVIWGNTYKLRMKFAEEVNKIFNLKKREIQQKLF